MREKRQMSFDYFHHFTIFSSTLGFACHFPFLISILLTQMARFNCANCQVSVGQLQMALILSHREFRVVLLELSMFLLLFQPRESHSQPHLRPPPLLVSTFPLHVIRLSRFSVGFPNTESHPLSALFSQSPIHHSFLILPFALSISPHSFIFSLH